MTKGSLMRKIKEGEARLIASSYLSLLLPRIGLIHESNLSCDSGPFELSSQRLVALFLLELIPFEEFVSGGLLV